MKWSKQWVAAVMLLPGIYLAGCGSGNNEGDRKDTLSTQSPPPADPGYSLDTTSSSIRGGGTDIPGSATTGSTAATGNTGSESGNTGLSSSDEATASTTVTPKKAVRKSTKSNTYSRSYRTARKSNLSRETTNTSDKVLTPDPTADKPVSTDVEIMADTAAKKIHELGDTTARKIGELGDTVTNKMENWVDSTSKKVEKWGDTTANRMSMLTDTTNHNLHHQGDSSTIYPDSSSTSGSTVKALKSDSTQFALTDSSRKISPADTGINFSSTVFIPDQIRGNYAEIKMARMAIDKSQNDEVKQIAGTLENDHNILLRELQTMARNSMSGNDSIPTSENDMARHHMDMMKNLTGQEFDRQWLQHMHMMHDQKVQMFEQAETNNSIHDAELRIWVNKTLPTLRKHRDMLTQALNTINK